MSENAANAQIPTTAGEQPVAPGTVPQDVKPTAGSGETANEIIEKYEAERQALLAEPDQPTTPEVIPPVVPPVVPPETPLAEGETELDDQPPGATPEPVKAPRYRLKPQDGVEAVAFKLRAEADKAGKTLSMEEAIAQAKALPVFKQAPAPSQPGLTELPGADATYEQVIDYLKGAQPQTTAELQTLESLARSKRKDAIGRDLNMDAVAELDDILYDLRKHETTISNRALTARQAQVNEFNQRADASKVKALELYPDVSVEANANGQTPLVAEMMRLDKILKDSGNDLYDSADKPLKLAQMAANNLGIAPGAKPAASPQPTHKPSRPVQPPIAGGGARTTQASTPTGQLEDRLNKISTPEELEAARLEFANER